MGPDIVMLHYHEAPVDAILVRFQSEIQQMFDKGKTDKTTFIVHINPATQRSDVNLPKDYPHMARDLMEHMTQTLRKKATAVSGTYVWRRVIEWCVVEIMYVRMFINNGALCVSLSPPHPLPFQVGLPFLDHFIKSDSRWFSSHDGCHYTKFAKNPNWGLDWIGGESYVHVMTLYNFLCNKKCGVWDGTGDPP
jgi:hypothetical protein